MGGIEDTLLSGEPFRYPPDDAHFLIREGFRHVGIRILYIPTLQLHAQGAVHGGALDGARLPSLDAGDADVHLFGKVLLGEGRDFLKALISPHELVRL